MIEGIITASYIIAALCFILSLAGLSKQESAERGNWFGIIGMTLVVIATIASGEVTGYPIILGAMAIGAIIGIRLALKVEMTNMPELVAILHSFVGLCAVLVGFNSFFEHGGLTGASLNIHLTEIFLGVFIGAVTFTGSVAAFGKLRGILDSKPLMLPHRHKLNFIALLVSVVLLGDVCVGQRRSATAFNRHCHCTGVRLASGGFHWWRGYAGGDFHA